MYFRKATDDHLPILMITSLGNPAAAAVVAAPIQKEWDVKALSGKLRWPVIGVDKT